MKIRIGLLRGGRPPSSKVLPASKRNLRVPFSWLLVVPFAIQVFGAVGLVGYLSYKNGQRAINDLAQQLEQEISLRVDQYLVQWH